MALFSIFVLIANNVDPDQLPHYVASDLGLHCLLMTLLQVSRLELVKGKTLLQWEQIFHL